MPERFPVLIALLVALMPFQARAQASSGGACDDSKLPYALNLGLPRLPDSPELQGDKLQTEVGNLFAAFYKQHGRCPSRKLQINITVAGDYQILDWLGQGLLDVAVVPDLTVYLLTQRDAIPLQEMDVADQQMGNLLLSTVSFQPRSERFTGGGWETRDYRQDFADFLAAAWSRTRHPASRQAPAAPVPGYRIILASHLSTPGFLDPVAEAARSLEGFMKGIEDGAGKDGLADRFWRTFFASAHFAVGCDSLDHAAGARSCWLPADVQGGKQGTVDILFPGEGVLSPGERAKTRPDARSSEHLVIGARGEPIFMGLRPAAVQLPPALEALFKPRNPAAPSRNPPAPFLPILDPEPTFGVRTFGFTVDEAFRLLRREQVPSERRLALVLPGGGVKAAYQSRIIDELYRESYLRNVKAPAATRGEPLDVTYVIGTSGGALLGYFVSQLGEKGPWNLSEILWKKKDPFQTADRFLESTDIFNWTDLLRYASVIASFLVFCALLALLSIPERGPLRPTREEVASRRRPWLIPLIFLLLLVAPFLVRQANGSAPREQIPEFEGMIYALLAMIAMFADQSVIHEGEDRQEGHGGPWVHPLLLTVAGALLVALPLLAQAKKVRLEFLVEPVTFGPAFAVLAPLVLLGGLILPLRSTARVTGGRGGLRMLLEFLLPAGLALALYFLLPDRWLDALKMPFFLSGFLLVLVSLGANFFLGRYAAAEGWGWRLGYYAALLLSALLLLNLCWPGEVDPAKPWAPLGKHTLAVTGGTFLVCVGLLFLMIGGVAWIYSAHRRYHLRLQDFLFAYVVVLLHAMAVYAVLVLALKYFPNWLSLLELTREFWLWLLLTSLVLGSVLLLAALGKLGGRESSLVKYLHGSFQLLCSHHPNGDFVTRRFLRMAAFSVFSLFWWNLVIAPALYGNEAAHKYLEDAIDRFEARTGAREGGLDYRPTASFIAPANLLAKDGTRYFLFVPRDERCPPFPRRTSGGAKWLTYEARLADATAPSSAADCKPIPSKKFLHDVIFASGSPFPIFPAHQVDLGGSKEPFVDGGYSNNIPVDVAKTVSANQVLIVDSTSPLSSSTPPGFLGRCYALLTGDLVQNLGRLPGFLFERSQQTDRLSRSALLVVSLAPSPPAPDEPAWPPLFDFRRQTVERMESTAKRDLGLRIGLVESWGQPRFQLSVPVEGSLSRP